MMTNADRQVNILMPRKNARARIATPEVTHNDFAVAENVIDRLRDEFEANLSVMLNHIRKEFELLCKTPWDDTARDNLFRSIHDLKGQAGTFSYDLITLIGSDLCSFLKQEITMTESRLKVIRYYIDAMIVVADNNITGLGGDQGTRMVKTLKGLSQLSLKE